MGFYSERVKNVLIVWQTRLCAMCPGQNVCVVGFVWMIFQILCDFKNSLSKTAFDGTACAEHFVLHLESRHRKTVRSAKPHSHYLDLWAWLFVCVFALFKTQCQQELDQVLERISKMPFRDNRGPLEDLYALHIPNCDKRGQYNLKQVTWDMDTKFLQTQSVFFTFKAGKQEICRQSYNKIFPFLSARCLSMVRGASAGAWTPTPADASHQPRPWGVTPTAANTLQSWSCCSLTLPRFNVAWNDWKQRKTLGEKKKTSKL